jgi:hypothetical protein
MAADYRLEVFKTVLTLLVAAISLSATWGIGQRLTNAWNLRQKRSELNLAAVQAFHSLYGEFKEVTKIWRLAKRSLRKPVSIPSDESWKLLVRACGIEGKSEALVIRLATDRVLLPGQITDIGLFRQAIQTLRQSIRDDVECPLGSRREEYELLNELAPAVASVVRDEPMEPPGAHVAQSQLSRIVGVTSEDWKQKVAGMKSKEGMKPKGVSSEDEDA